MLVDVTVISTSQAQDVRRLALAAFEMLGEATII